MQDVLVLATESVSGSILKLKVLRGARNLGKSLAREMNHSKAEPPTDDSSDHVAVNLRRSCEIEEEDGTGKRSALFDSRGVLGSACVSLVSQPPTAKALQHAVSLLHSSWTVWNRWETSSPRSRSMISRVCTTR